MNFGPVQSGIYWLIVGSGALVGIPDRIGAVTVEPTAANISLLFISSGIISCLALLKLKPF